MDLEALTFSVITGMAVGYCAYIGRPAYDVALGYIERNLATRFRTLRFSTRRLRLWLNVWVASLAIIFLVMWIGLDRPVFGVLLAVIFAAGPWYLVARWAKQRRQKIEDQLADALVTFSSAVRAGLSIPQALGMLAEEAPQPIRQEFQQIVGEYNLGKPLERTLEESKARLRSENFILFAAALLASRESGGKLNETVERISKSVLELQRLERKVRSETAQARKSAVYMSVIPVIILVVFSQVDPDNTSLLFNTFPGQLLLSIAVVLNLVAYFWAVKILNPDI